MAFCLLLSAQGLAKEIKVAVGLSLTPYVIKSKGTGIELDIVTKALSSQGHTPKFIYVPFDQIAEAVKSGKADAGLTLQEAVGGAFTLVTTMLSIKMLRSLLKSQLLMFQVFQI